MKIVLICLNLLAAALTYPAMLVCHEMYCMAFSSGYTELDRSQIINREKLKEAHPKEYENDRYEIPRLYMAAFF